MKESKEMHMRELRGKKGKQEEQYYCIIVSKEEKYKKPIFSPWI